MKNGESAGRNLSSLDQHVTFAMSHRDVRIEEHKIECLALPLSAESHRVRLKYFDATFQPVRLNKLTGLWTFTGIDSYERTNAVKLHRRSQRECTQACKCASFQQNSRFGREHQGVQQVQIFVLGRARVRSVEKLGPLLGGMRMEIRFAAPGESEILRDLKPEFHGLNASVPQPRQVRARQK